MRSQQSLHTCDGQGSSEQEASEEEGRETGAVRGMQMEGVDLTLEWRGGIREGMEDREG